LEVVFLKLLHRDFSKCTDEDLGAHGSLEVKALFFKPEGGGFKT
jgi:hypothetical protein